MLLIQESTKRLEPHGTNAVVLIAFTPAYHVCRISCIQVLFGALNQYIRSENDYWGKMCISAVLLCACDVESFHCGGYALTNRSVGGPWGPSAQRRDVCRSILNKSCC